MFCFFDHVEHSRAAAAAVSDEAVPTVRTLLGQVDQVLPQIGVPVQMVADVAAPRGGGTGLCGGRCMQRRFL